MKVRVDLMAFVILFTILFVRLLFCLFVYCFVYLSDDGFCRSIREVNCTFDIFPFVECNPFCISPYVS